MRPFCLGLHVLNVQVTRIVPPIISVRWYVQLLTGLLISTNYAIKRASPLTGRWSLTIFIIYYIYHVSPFFYLTSTPKITKGRTITLCSISVHETWNLFIQTQDSVYGMSSSVSWYNILQDSGVLRGKISYRFSHIKNIYCGISSFMYSNSDFAQVW